VARKWLRSERPNAEWAQRYGDAFDLAMGYFQKSIRQRRWRLALSATTVTALPLLLLATTIVLVAILKTGLPYINPADEWSSFGIEPQHDLKSNLSTDTPRAIPGGRVIGTAELELAVRRGMLDGSPFLPIDVAYYRDENHVVVPEIGAHHHINRGGQAGTFDDEIQKELKERLAELTKGDLNMPLVFFCIGARCWLSYNASLRAVKLGYTRVYWYRGGINAWRAVRNPLHIDFKQIPVEPRGLLESGANILASLKQEVWPSADYDFRSGQDYLKRQQFDKAVDAFTRALTHYPNNVEYRHFRGRAYDQKGEHAKALEDYDKIIIADPKNLDVLDRRGVARYQIKDFDGAIADFAKTLEFDPHSNTKPRLAESYRRRGYERFLARDYDRSLDDYNKAIEIEPKALFYVNRGGLWEARGDWARAVEDYSTAIEIDSKNQMAYYARAKIYDLSGDYVRAIADYSNASEINSSDVRYIVARGRAQFHRGEFARAVADFGRAKQIDPKFNEIKYLVLFHYLARMRAQAGGTATIELEADAAQTGMNNAWPYPIAELFMGRREPTDTLKAATKPDHVCEARFYIGQWHLLRGEKDDAISEIKIAANTCDKRLWEYAAAVADLKRLSAAR
jgi:PQQ-dependent catabolism-associated CXXCW motif protein